MTEIEMEKSTETGTESVIYELGYLVVPTIAEDQISGEVSKIREIIEESGFIVSEMNPEIRTLAYEMQKTITGRKQHFHSAYFGVVVFQAQPKDVKNITNDLKKDNHILRFLIMKRTKESFVIPKSRIHPRANTIGKDTDNKKEKKQEINKQELDKTIEELVVD